MSEPRAEDSPLLAELAGSRDLRLLRAAGLWPAADAPARYEPRESLMNRAEFESLARHVAKGWANCGRNHAVLVAEGIEKDLSISLRPGDLMERAEQMLIERAEQAKLNAAAARGIVAGIDPSDIGDGIHAGLEHVVDRAFHAAADIEEVLRDGVKLAESRP